MKLPTLRPGTQVVSRLRFTFLFIVAMVTIAAIIGSLQLFSLWKSQEKLLAESIPSLVQTEELARELTALLAITSQLGERQTSDGLRRLQENIGKRNAALRNAIASIPNTGSVAPIRREFETVQRQLEEAISQLISLRHENLHAQATLNKNVDDLRNIRTEIAGITEPLLTDAAIAVDSALDASSTDGSPQSSDSRSEIASAVSLLNALTELAFQINLSIDAAERLSLTTEAAQSTLSTKRLQFAFRTIAQLLLRLKDDENRRNLARKVKELRNSIFGPGGISQNLRELKKGRDRFLTEKEKQLDLTRTISAISTKFVTAAKRDIEETAISLDQSLLTTLAVLAATLIATFLVTGAVIYFVVERQINRRMARLTAAVRRIASGNTDHNVPVIGPDELGEMAKALEVFKANARELRRSNEELQKFAYVASHDLRSPLQAIRNLAEWTLEDAGDTLSAEGRSNLKMMLQRVERLSNLLTDLLEYAQAGRTDSNVTAIDVRKTVLDLAELVDPSGRFELKFSGNAQTVETYATPLRQILLNLINNATKHHDRDHGQIAVNVQKVGSRIQFAVTDDGPGIDPDYHDRVFGLFETLKSRDEIEGSGLGLAIIRKLVEYHGGTITVKSDPQRARGTTFTFDFPDMHEPAESQSAANPKPARRKPSEPDKIAVKARHPVSRILPKKSLLQGQ